MPRIRARQRLEFCTDIMASMPSDDRGAAPYLVALVCQAYPDDERARATLIESITRR